MANLLLVASLDVRTWVLIATSWRLAWRNWGEGISWAQALTLFLQLPQFSLRQNGFELCCTLNFQGGWHHQCLPSQLSKTWLSPGFFGGSEHRTGLTWEPLGLPSQPARFGSKWLSRDDPEALFNNLVTSLLSRWKTLGLPSNIRATGKFTGGSELFGCTVYLFSLRSPWRPLVVTPLGLFMWFQHSFSGWTFANGHVYVMCVCV